MQYIEYKQKILFMSDIEQIIGRNRLTIRRWWTSGKFPKPIKLNGTTLAWHSNIVEQWIHQNMNTNLITLQNRPI